MQINRQLSFVIVLLSLAGCGGYAPVNFQPVAVPDALTRVARSRNFQVADSGSFVDAVMRYPNRTGKPVHTIPVGDYLLSRVVLALPDDADISKIRLAGHDSTCEGRGVFSPHLWCTTTTRLEVTAKSMPRLLSVYDEADVGPVMVVGDIAPPFTMGDTFEGIIHGQARQAVDHLAPKIREAFRSGAN